jgi:hypothetical protein
MENSVQLEHYGGHLIDGIVRLRENGTVLILTRDKLGIQKSECIDLSTSPKKFGYFVRLPILNNRNKRKYIEEDLRRLYKHSFPSQPLPKWLEYFENTNNGIISQFNQLTLF